MQLLPLLIGPVMLVIGLLAWTWDEDGSDTWKGRALLMVLIGGALSYFAYSILDGLRHGGLFI